MKKLSNIQRRAQRVRISLRKVANGHHRLSVYRSSKNIYAQIIDDLRGITIASASTLDSDLRQALKTGGNVEAASAVGRLVAERAKKASVTQVIFDRGSSVYHGRVKALAEAAREGGLSF